MFFGGAGVRVLVGVTASYDSSWPRVGGGSGARGAAAVGGDARRLSWAPPGPMAPPGRTGERSCAIWHGIERRAPRTSGGAPRTEINPTDGDPATQNCEGADSRFTRSLPLPS